MFENGKQYWLKLKGVRKDEVNIKGTVLDENNFFVKLQLDDGRVTIVPFVRVLDVNEVREEQSNL